MSIALLIPAFKPPDELLMLVQNCVEHRFTKHVIIVDDGSGQDYSPIFVALENIDTVTVLRHSVNLGKGAALKTGLNHCYLSQDITGVVTADADGQHLASDIEKVTNAIQDGPKCLVLGSRDFGDDVPFRSRFGNIVTRYVFRFLLGAWIQDTQTGLRGIPRELIPHLLRLKSNRYEFEMDMLTIAAQLQYSIREIPIKTIYISNNKSSHFNPLVDSLRIYFTLLRFSMASGVTFSVDIVVFSIALHFSHLLFLANAVARIVATPVYFFLTRDFVFLSEQNGFKPVKRYLLVVAVSGLVSYLGQLGIQSISPSPPTLNKIGIETIMFFVNFLILRDFVYSDARQKE